jgi:hypothetical protein
MKQKNTESILPESAAKVESNRKIANITSRLFTIIAPGAIKNHIKPQK